MKRLIVKTVRMLIALMVVFSFVTAEAWATETSVDEKMLEKMYYEKVKKQLLSVDMEEINFSFFKRVTLRELKRTRFGMLWLSRPNFSKDILFRSAYLVRKPDRLPPQSQRGEKQEKKTLAPPAKDIFTYYPGGLWKTREVMNEERGELKGKHVKYYYKDEQTSKGCGRVYRVDSITDGWYYDIGYSSPEDPSDDTVMFLKRRDIDTGALEAWVEYYDSGRIKRYAAFNGDVIEFLDEDWNGWEFGKVALTYDASSESYKTYDWWNWKNSEGKIKVVGYEGAYETAFGDEVRSDVDYHEKRLYYAYQQTDEDEWYFKMVTFLDDCRFSVARYTYYENGRIESKEYVVHEGEFAGHRVRYYYLDEKAHENGNKKNRHGRIYEIGVFGTVEIHYITYVEPDNPRNDTIASIKTIDSRRSSNGKVLREVDYYADGIIKRSREAYYDDDPDWNKGVKCNVYDSIVSSYVGTVVGTVGKAEKIKGVNISEIVSMQDVLRQNRSEFTGYPMINKTPQGMQLPGGSN